MVDFASFSAILWVRIEWGFIRFPVVHQWFVRTLSRSMHAAVASFVGIQEEFSGHRY